MRITHIAARTHTIELPRRGRVPLDAGPAKPVPTVGVLICTLQTDSGLTGTGISTLGTVGLQPARELLETEIAPLVMGESAWDAERLYAKTEAHFRVAGFAGLAARAYAAADVALWDLAAQAAGVPLAVLLGNRNPGGVRYILSDTTGAGWDAAEVAKHAATAIQAGALGVRVELGSDVQADAERIRELHDALPDEAWLGVSARGGYDVSTALAIAHFFEDQGIDWLEDPLPAADLIGYERLARTVEIPVAVGATFDRPSDFLQFLTRGLVRVIRPDVSRLGGITPVRKLATLAEAFHVAVVPVRLPEVSVHLAAGLPAVSMADQVPWLSTILTGGPTITNGRLTPPTTPGLGFTC